VGAEVVRSLRKGPRGKRVDVKLKVEKKRLVPYDVFWKGGEKWVGKVQGKVKEGGSGVEAWLSNGIL